MTLSTAVIATTMKALFAVMAVSSLLTTLQEGDPLTLRVLFRRLTVRATEMR